MKKVFKKIIEQGKGLPKPVWIAAVLMPFGFEFLGAYIIVKAVLRKKDD